MAAQTVPENLNALADSTDMVEALDRLQAMAPAVESVSLVVAWFGERSARGRRAPLRPGVEVLGQDRPRPPDLVREWRQPRRRLPRQPR